MPHSKAAASPVQTLEITLAGAPKTPPRGTKCAVEAGEDVDTPNAMRRTASLPQGFGMGTINRKTTTPNAMRRTASLPQSFGMGTINLKTTTEHMRAQTGRDLVYGLVPDNAIIKTKILYNKHKAKISSNVILVTKDEDKGTISVCWYLTTYRPSHDHRNDAYHNSANIADRRQAMVVKV